ncbi:hypothetical protein [Schleiferilactobacillus harbinensis]|uniref:hypothetical protein n=1 Tax=Schleiferilactobacillus harbinensis TaxID=304207 RepID=UPI0039EBF925
MLAVAFVAVVELAVVAKARAATCARIPPDVPALKEVDMLAETPALVDAEADAEALALADALADAEAEALALADVDVEATGIVSVSLVANTSCVPTCLLVPTVVSALTVDAPTAPPPIIPAKVAMPATSQRLPDL